MRETLPLALKLMFGDEGAYSNRKTDAGGPTKYGITWETLSGWRGKPCGAEEVKALTLAEAEAIYRANFWTQSGGDLLPAGLDYAAFDFGVNSSPARAVRALQKLVGARPDGNVGVKTLDKIRAYGPLEHLIRDYCAARMTFLRGIKGEQGWSVNGRGWTIRVIGTDPKGEWPSKPGVVGNAIALASSAIAEPELVPTMPAPLPRATGAPAPLPDIAAKAPPQEPKASTSPEMITTGATAAGGVLAALSGLQGPVAYAVAAVLVIGFVVGAVYIVRRIRSQPA